MHSRLTLDLKEGEDLILLTQTKHLSFKKHETEVNKFLQKKKLSYSGYDLPSAPALQRPYQLRLSDFRFKAPINQFCTF